MRRVEVSTDVGFNENIDDDPEGRFVLFAEAASDRAALVRELEEARANYRFMVERAADQKLDGYRELAQKLNMAEAEVARLTEALRHSQEQAMQCLIASGIAAEQKLAAAVDGMNVEQSRRETEQRLRESVEQKLAAAEREAERWQACAEGLKSDLAAAERESVSALNAVLTRLEAAEARVRELEVLRGALEVLRGALEVLRGPK